MEKIVEKIVEKIKNGSAMIVRGIIGLMIAIGMSIIGLIVTICVIVMMAVTLVISVIATMFGMDKLGDLGNEIMNGLVNYIESKWD